MRPMSDTPPVNKLLLREAADWAIVFQYDQPDAKQQLAFDRWRQQSPAHEIAWQRAQSVFRVFDQLPPSLNKRAVKKLERGYDRRRALELLSGALIALPCAWWVVRDASWQRWTADARTVTGETRAITLPDGSQLVLNTGSAVNIVFNEHERRIRLLRGEILITTATDTAASYRPFIIDTAQGSVQALGTRFSVRQLSSNLHRVAVFEHRVEIRNLMNEQRILHAGEQADFSLEQTSMAVPVLSSAALWEQGILLAKNMRLADVVSELSRYRSGVLRCESDIADLRVSGAISLLNIDDSLALLEQSLPVRIRRRTPFWTVVAGL